ncbi:MAG: hypothetical protein ABJA90_05525 [Ginsengibacter sp.]
MPAYNITDLYNQIVLQEASDAFQTTCIKEESYKKIIQSHTSKLYTPNYFIRIALGIVTIIAVLFTSILLGLLFASSGSSPLMILCFLFAVACYVALELIVKTKHHYNAGVDNILMTSVIVFFTSTFFMYDSTTNYILISGVMMVLSLYLCVRFTDAFMATISYICLFIFIFLLYLKLGTIAKITAPFVMIFLSAFVYLLMKKLEVKEHLLIYNFCIRAVMFFTLLTFYASSNYFVIKELSNEMFGLNLTTHDGIPFGWLFWMLTILIPLSYIFYGVKKKDFLFIRTGLGLIAATVFTIRYYENFLSAELAMLSAGVIMVGVSYALIQYLKISRHGYTSRNLHPANKNLLNVEALIIAQTLGTTSKTDNNNLFGGGSGGGGGASGNF